MLEHKAIVVLEDLNFGFMRGRQKVERQVYQKFEKMLIDKLNYLVNKEAQWNSDGGVLRAYQLTNKFESFQKLGRQSGFLYYIPAWNTSKMDPTTGFVNLFYIKYENIEKTKRFFSLFDDIRYNADEKYFEFEFDYLNFTNKADGTRTDWVVCTAGDRILTARNPEKNHKWDSTLVPLTNVFMALFEKYDMDIFNKLKNQILQQTEAAFFKELTNLFKLTMQMRNSKSGSEEDYLISPVKNKDGKFYNSSECGDLLPQNADANGAYNIARKGLWVIEQIRNTPDDRLDKVKLAISNKEWLQYAQR